MTAGVAARLPAFRLISAAARGKRVTTGLNHQPGADAPTQRSRPCAVVIFARLKLVLSTSSLALQENSTDFS